MKKENLIKKLENNGYKIVYRDLNYWNNIPCVKLNNGSYLALEVWVTNYKYNNFTIDYYNNITYNEVINRIKELEENSYNYGEYNYIKTKIYK